MEARQSGERSRDRGSITGFVVVITLMVMACAGLAVDGGRVVAAKVTAADHAENAARAAAQELTQLRTGGWVIDPARASATAHAYLATHGVGGTVQASPTSVSVTVLSTVSTTLLRLVGVPSKTVSVTRTSYPTSQ